MVLEIRHRLRRLLVRIGQPLLQIRIVDRGEDRRHLILIEGGKAAELGNAQLDEGLRGRALQRRVRRSLIAAGHTGQQSQQHNRACLDRKRQGGCSSRTVYRVPPLKVIATRMPAVREIEVEHRDTIRSFLALTLAGRLVMVERYL